MDGKTEDLDCGGYFIYERGRSVGKKNNMRQKNMRPPYIGITTSQAI